MPVFSEQAVEDVKRGVEAGKPVRGPFDVQILPVDFCNLMCGFCPVQAVPEGAKARHAPRFKTGKLKMEWHIFAKIVAGLKELGHVERVHITGGEPLLHPDIARMVGELKENLGADHVALVSNGTALKGRVDALLDAGLDRLSTSINSVHEKTRRLLSPGEPPDTITKIREGLLDFGKKRRATNTDLALTSVLTVYSCKEVKAQFEFARDVGAASLTFLPLMGFEYEGVLSTQKLMVDKKQFTAFLQDIERIQGEAAKAGIWVGYSGPRESFGTLLTPDMAKIPCYTGFAFAMFWPDGSVRPCCNCEESMGNILRQPLVEIWHGEKYSRFRMELLQSRRRGDCSCRECGYLFENKEIFSRIGS